MGKFWLAFRYIISMPVAVPIMLFIKDRERLMKRINKFVFWEY